MNGLLCCIIILYREASPRNIVRKNKTHIFHKSLVFLSLYNFIFRFQHFIPALCMQVSWSLHCHLVDFCEEKKVIYLLFFCFCIFFFIFFIFFTSFWFTIFFTSSARASSLQLIAEFCASPSTNLISLSYSMLVFSANLFGLFK